MKLLGRKFKFAKLFLLIGVLFIITPMIFSLDYNSMLVIFRPGIRKMERQIVNYKSKGYSFVESENFILRYQEDVSMKVVNLVAKTAEDKHKYAVEYFNYQPTNKIMIVLYDEVDSLMKATMLRKGSPPMGVYYGDALHILDPHYWIGEDKDFEDVFSKEGPILHELVHLFVDHSAGGNYPLWFTEGVSLYFEYEFDGYEWGKDEEIDMEEYSLKNLTDNFHKLDEYLAYTQSFRIIKNFVEREGLDALIDTIYELARGKGPGQLMEDFEWREGLFWGD